MASVILATDPFCNMHWSLLNIDMDTPERGILRNAGKNEHGDEEANLGAVKEQQDGVQSGNSSGRDGKA